MYYITIPSRRPHPLPCPCLAPPPPCPRPHSVWRRELHPHLAPPLARIPGGLTALRRPTVLQSIRPELGVGVFRVRARHISPPSAVSPAPFPASVPPGQHLLGMGTSVRQRAACPSPSHRASPYNHFHAAPITAPTTASSALEGKVAKKRPAEVGLATAAARAEYVDWQLFARWPARPRRR